MKQADLIWMNGDFVAVGGRQGPRPDARPALRHGRLRGHPLLRHRDRPGGLPPPATTSTGSARSAELYYMAGPVRRRSSCAQATLELIARNGLRVVLHPPARLPRLRPDGPVPARRAGRRRRSPCGSGAPTSARRASSNGVRAKVSSWRRISPDSLIPQAKACGPVPQLGAREDRVAQGRLRGGASSSTTTATSARARARTSSSCATA